MPFLLDTNIVIALFAGESGVVAQVRTVEQTDRMRVSSIVVGELHYGARKSAKPAENSRRIDGLSTRAIVVQCDADTGRVYGAIKHALRIKGTPIPENDIWIAASAIQHGLALVTRDSHFAKVEGLSIAQW